MSDVNQFWNSTTGEWEPGQISGGAQKVMVVGNLVNDGYPIAPSDTLDLPHGVTVGLYVGVTGDVAVVLASGSAVTFTGLSGGMVHPIAVKRVKAAGTTATSLLAVY